MNLSTHHILGVEDLNNQDVELILKTAENLKEISLRPVKKVPALRGKTILLCFFESSTRTRASFEMAAKRLSADTLNFSATDSSINKGESILDTVRNLQAMDPDLLVVRHSFSGIPHLLAKAVRCPVINAGDGLHEHPTQALLDLLTIQNVKKKIKTAIKIPPGAHDGSSIFTRACRRTALGMFNEKLYPLRTLQRNRKSKTEKRTVRTSSLSQA